MDRNELIFLILTRLQEKAKLQPDGTVLRYNAGFERLEGVTPQEEIAVLNSLEDEGLIQITGNFFEYE